MATRRSSVSSAAASNAGFRQISVIFNPWQGRHTTCTVVTVDHLGSHRVVHRVGSISLDVGRPDLVGLAASEVTALLVDHLHAWLSERRPTLPRAMAPGAPSGGHGGGVEQVPGQLSLNLALRD